MSRSIQATECETSLCSDLGKARIARRVKKLSRKFLKGQNVFPREDVSFLRDSSIFEIYNPSPGGRAAPETHDSSRIMGSNSDEYFENEVLEGSSLTFLSHKMSVRVS